MDLTTRIKRFTASALLATSLYTGTQAYAFDIPFFGSSGKTEIADQNEQITELRKIAKEKREAKATAELQTQSKQKKHATHHKDAYRSTSSHGTTSKKPCDDKTIPCPTHEQTMRFPDRTLLGTHVEVYDVNDNKIKDTYVRITSSKTTADKHAMWMEKADLETLCPGEYVKINWPKREGVESYLPKRWNDNQDFFRVGKDFIITYDEVRALQGGAVNLVYDVLEKINGHDCDSYKVPLVVTARPDCDDSYSRRPEPERPAPEQPTPERPSPRPEKPKHRPTHNPGPTIIPPPGSTVIILPPPGTLPSTKTPPPGRIPGVVVDTNGVQAHAPYSQFEFGVGTYCDQVKGKDEAGKEVAPLDFSGTRVAARYRHFGNNNIFSLAGVYAWGDEAGSPEGPYSTFCSEKQTAWSLGIADTYRFWEPIKGFGPTIGAEAEVKNITTWNYFQGEDSNQFNASLGAKVGLMVGQPTGTYFEAGVGANVQQIMDKQQSWGDKIYDAGTSYELLPMFFADGKFIFNETPRSRVYAGLQARYSPDVSTIYGNTGQTLTRTSNYANIALDLGIEGKHSGLDLRVKAAKNDETWRDDSSKKERSTSRNGASIQLNYTYKW